MDVDCGEEKNKPSTSQGVSYLICDCARKNQPYAAFLWSSFLYRLKNVLDTALILVYFLGKPFKS